MDSYIYIYVAGTFLYNLYVAGTFLYLSTFLGKLR
jgi:hypothetical protein